MIASEALRAKRPKAVEPQVGETREVYDCKNRTSLPGTLVRREDEPDTEDETVSEAYDAAGLTYKLFHDLYGRDSFDGKNALLKSSVHYGKGFDNAFWDGTQMVYGDGKIFNRFTSDLSVIGHELTHGVTEYTSGLVYRNQSGALNEHVSDVFGALTEQYAQRQTAEEASWLIGAALVTGKVEGKALRDMENPGTAYDDPVIGRDPQPNHMDRYVKTTSDNGGVHINSGIPNRAFVIAAKILGGYAYAGIGAVWYHAIANKVTKNFTFQQFAEATVASANEIAAFGRTEADPTLKNAVITGWETVGIIVKDVPAPPPAPEEPSPCNLGDLFNVNPAQVREILSSPEYKRLFVRVKRILKG